MNAHSPALLSLETRWRLPQRQSEGKTEPLPPPFSVAQLTTKVPVRYLKILLDFHCGQADSGYENCTYVAGLAAKCLSDDPPVDLSELTRRLNPAINAIAKQTLRHMREHKVTGEDAGVADYFEQHHDEILQTDKPRLSPK